MLTRIFLFIILFFSPSCYAWNAANHKIIAQIAYDNLTPKAKVKINQLGKKLDPYFQGDNSFIQMATWADQFRFQNMPRLSQWHYINIPFSTDKMPLPAIEENNIIAITQQSLQVLSSPITTTADKALFLMLLVHLVGDIHQPLHASTRISKKLPHGDYGGNLYPIKTRYARNLHSYWDRGLDFAKLKRQRPTLKQVKKIAQLLEHEYPKTYLAKQIEIQAPMAWAEESHAIAQNFAYTTPKNKRPSAHYVRKGRRIVKRQLTLAGYRLAYCLNKILDRT